MRFFLLPLLISLLFAGTAAAVSVEARLLRTLKLEGTPKQVVASPDGQRIYVLTESGDIHLHAVDGSFQGSFQGGEGITSITPQGSNRLVVVSADRKEMQLLALEPIVEISTEGAATLGNPAAPVTIVVFDDFECPYCAKAVPLFKQVLAAYPDDVKLVFKNFPLGMHKNAQAAAIAGLAAQRQGKFWPLHDLLFANYNRLSPQKIEQLAEEAGLDMEQYRKDFNNPALAQQLKDDMTEGQKIGVRGTPTVFVNGRRLQQRSKAGFDQIIKAELVKLKR